MNVSGEDLAHLALTTLDPAGRTTYELAGTNKPVTAFSQTMATNPTPRSDVAGATYPAGATSGTATTNATITLAHMDTQLSLDLSAARGNRAIITAIFTDRNSLDIAITSGRHTVGSWEPGSDGGPLEMPGMMSRTEDEGLLTYQDFS